MIEIVDDIVSYIDFYQEDVFSICEKVFDNRKTNEFIYFKNINNGDFNVKWLNATDKINKIADPKAIEAFKRVGKILGSYKKEVQIEKLKSISSDLKELYDIKIGSYNANKKIIDSLSLGIGFIISLIFI